MAGNLFRSFSVLTGTTLPMRAGGCCTNNSPATVRDTLGSQQVYPGALAGDSWTAHPASPARLGQVSASYDPGSPTQREQSAPEPAAAARCR